MSVGSSLQKVVDVIASFEQNGTDITSIETSESGLSPATGLTVEFSTSSQLFDDECIAEDVAFSIDAASIDTDGTLRLDLTATPKIKGAVPTPSEDSNPRGESILDVDSKSAEDETVNIERQRGDDAKSSQDDDPEALRAVYRECDSFREMRDALDSDVTPETIRRRMISHGIHTVPSDEGGPVAEGDETASDMSGTDHVTDGDNGNKTDTNSLSLPEGDENAPIDGEDIQEPILPDGGIAADLTLEELVDVVQSSNTIYQAHQRLDLDQDRTRRLLREFGLIDLVVGRLATLEDRTVTREEIERRIRTTDRLTET